MCPKPYRLYFNCYFKIFSVHSEREAVEGHLLAEII